MSAPPLDSLRPSATILATSGAAGASRPVADGDDAGFPVGAAGGAGAGGPGAAPTWGGAGGAPGAAPGGSPAPGVSPVALDGDIEPLNLARRPFVNTRPVLRVAALLVGLGLVLLLVNVSLFMGYLNSSQATRTLLAKLTSDTAKERDEVARLTSSIDGLSLDQENREVAFLNRKIDERTFSWSLLFDRLSTILPDQVRLLQLRPTNVVQKETGARSREPKQLPVLLQMSCETKDDEAMLRFVDNLFAHPAFAEPNLIREERHDDGLVTFEINVQYQPAQALHAAAPRLGAAGSSGTGSAKDGRSASGSATRTAADAAPSAGSADAAPAAPQGAAASQDAVAGAPPRPAMAAGAGLVNIAPPGSPGGPAAGAGAGTVPPRTVPPQRLIPRHRGNSTLPIGAGSAPNNGVSEQ